MIHDESCGASIQNNNIYLKNGIFPYVFFCSGVYDKKKQRTISCKINGYFILRIRMNCPQTITVLFAIQPYKTMRLRFFANLPKVKTFVNAKLCLLLAEQAFPLVNSQTLRRFLCSLSQKNQSKRSYIILQKTLDHRDFSFSVI